MQQRTSKIDWPEGFDRTSLDDRGSYPGNLDIDYRTAFESVIDELERWGASDVRIESEGPHYVDEPHIPHKSADPDDPAVVAYFRREDEPADDGYAIACDRYRTQLENARAIALYARRMRLAERCGVTTATSTFETARLPPADEDAIAAEPMSREPHEVLEVAPDASAEVVQAAARRKIKDLHGDTNGGDGDPVKLNRVIDARDELLSGTVRDSDEVER